MIEIKNTCYKGTRILMGNEKSEFLENCRQTLKTEGFTEIQIPIIQELSKTHFKHHKDLKVFYIAECFRGENPQAGRYRQFTQLGVEILNPSKDHTEDLLDIAETLLFDINEDLVTNKDVTRGLDYYKEGKGFEISCEKLGSSKQICGGGTYEGGQGFAIGVDRILPLIINQQ